MEVSLRQTEMLYLKRSGILEMTREVKNALWTQNGKMHPQIAFEDEVGV